MKEKRLFRQAAAILVLLLFTPGLLAGCGQTTPESPADAEAETAAEAAPAETGSGEAAAEEAAQETAETEAASESTAEPGEVTLVYTNDVHTYVDNYETDEDGSRVDLLSYSNVAALKESLQAAGENVLLVDAGDFAQGTAYGAFDEGKSVVEIMNAAGYDIVTIGNHEFDYGASRLFAIIDELDCPCVSCDFYRTEDGSLLLPAYEILTVGGVRVAFIGITTPSTATTTPQTCFQDEDGNQIFSFYGTDDRQDLYDSVQTAIDEIGDQADYVIALSHLGIYGTDSGWTCYDVIENTTGLDAMIDGHSHTTIEGETVTDLDGNSVVLTQTGCYLSAIGVMRLSGSGITTELITDFPDRNADVQALTDRLVSDVEEALGQQIAVSDLNFSIMDPVDTDVRIVRNAETNIGDLFADGVYYYFNEVAGLDCDVAIVNGGGIRADLSAGSVSYLDVKTVHPFGNVECIVSMKGSALREMLEFGMRYVGETGEDGSAVQCGGFLQTAGLRFTVDSAVPSTVQMNSDGSWAGPPTGEYKVSDIRVYNRETGAYEALDPDRDYTVAGSNFTIRNYGDGYTVFADSTLVLDYVSEDYLAAAAYFEAFEAGEDGWPHLNSAASPLADWPGYCLDYENPYGSGRMTVK